MFHQYVYGLHYIYVQYLRDDVDQGMDYQEKLFQVSKTRNSSSLLLLFILSFLTSRCSGRKVKRVRFGASNPTGDALLFICGSVNRGTFVGGSHDELKFANNSADGGAPPK